MDSRSSFARLARLYGLIEQQHSVELRLAAQAEQEAVSARNAEADAWRQELEREREAVQQGSVQGRVLAESAMELRAADVRRLAQLQETRAAARETALQIYRASRTETDRMQRTTDRLRDAAKAEEDRRAQSGSDDRFASRREWVRTRKRHLSA